MNHQIEEFLLKKFKKVCAVNHPAGGDPPVWKSIFFLLDLLGQGDFYGRVEVIINGCSVKDPVLTRRTFKIDAMYIDIETLTSVPKDRSTKPKVLKSNDMELKSQELGD